MRIITGKYRGKKIRTIEDKSLRPTTSQVREALFNILNHNQEINNSLESSIFLELCSGIGIVSYEALSRGADRAIMIDKNSELKKLFNENARILDDKSEADFVIADVTSLPKAREQANICFIDPPYYDGLETKILNSLKENDWLADDALVIIESAKKIDFVIPTGYQKITDRLYGKTRLSFLKLAK